MHNPSAIHLSQRDLMHYADGELPPQEAANVKAHLEACWKCRLQAEQLEAAIFSLTEFCDSVLPLAAGPPPRGWRTFDAKLRGVVAETGKPSLLARLHLASFSVGLAPPFATIVVLLTFLVLWLQQPPAVSASQLLGRAAESRISALREFPEPVVYQRLRVQVDGVPVTREIWNDTANDRVTGAWSEPGTDASVAVNIPGVFAANRLDWQDPLSAAGFAEWRAGLGRKTDSVVREGSFWMLQTTAIGRDAGKGFEGRVVEASLTFRATDYHPVAGRFLFVLDSEDGNSEHEVEIAEEDYTVVALATVGPALFNPPPAVVPAPRPAQPLPAPVGPSPAELAYVEVAARYALHLAGADLGEPIEIEIDERQAPAVVVVEGLVRSEERRQELLAAIEEIPYVAPKLLTEEEAARQALPAATGVPGADVVSGQSPIQEQLQSYFGGPAEVEEFSRRAFAVTEALMARAWALHHLSDRYPEAHAQLNPSSRELVETMRREHRRALRGRAVELLALLEPVLLSFAEAPAEVPEGGELSAPPLFATSQEVERLTLGLLSGSGLLDTSDPNRIIFLNPAQAATDLLAALRGLELELASHLISGARSN